MAIRDDHGRTIDNPDCCKTIGCASQVPVLTGFSSSDYNTVTSLLLHKQDGRKFKDILVSNESIQIELSWTLPAPDKRVEYELWIDLLQQQSNDHHISESFFQDWKKVATL